MQKKLLLFTLLILVFVLLGVRATVTGNAVVPEVDTELVQKNNIRSSILASGQMAYKKQVELRSEVLGRVVEVLVEESDLVRKGDIVLRLDPVQLQIQVEQAQASLRQSELSVERQKLAVSQIKRKLTRQKSLFERNLIDEETFDDKSTELKFAIFDLKEKQQTLAQHRALFQQANENLDKTVFRAPIDGIVIKIDVKVGESVIAGATNIPGSTLMTIADTSEVLTEVHVDETDIAKVAIGQQANVYAVAFPRTPFTGTVRSIATTVTNSKRGRGLGFVVKVVLDDTKDRAVLPGISCRAEIFFASQKETLTVPIKAIIFEEQIEKTDQGEMNSYVFVDNQGIAERRKIKLGIANDTYQEVTSGVSLGERIVVGPYRQIQRLKDGAEIDSNNGKVGKLDG